MKDGRGYMQLIRMEVAAGSFSSAPLHLKCLCPLFLEMHLSVFPHCYHLNWTVHTHWRVFPFWRSPLHASDPRLLCDVVIFVQKKRYCGEKKPLVPLFTCNTSWYIETILIITLALLAFVPSNPRWSYFRTQNAQMVRGEPNLSSPPLMDTNSLPVVRELSVDLDITRFVWFLWRYLRYRWGTYEILGVLRFVIRIFYG